MTEHSPQNAVTVFQLAKELGVQPLSLVEKLRELNVHVKSHMVELRGEDADLARAAYRKSTDTGKKAPVRTTAARVRKRAPEPETEKAPTGASVSPEPPKKQQALSPIIRRRAAEAPTETPPAATMSPAVGEDIQDTVSLAQAKTQIEDSKAAQEALARAAQPAPEESEARRPEAQGAQSAQTQADAVQPRAAATPPPAQARPVVTLPPRPVAPQRKSILKIVEPQAPPMRPMIKPAAPSPKAVSKTPVRGTATQDKDGFRIIKMTKENLDQMAEEEAARKRAGKESEIRPEDVRFADYRKKEMVFLPRKKKLPVGKELKKTKLTTPKAQKRVVDFNGSITVQSLADQLGVKAPEVIKKLMGMGQMATLFTALDFDTASLVATEFQYEVRNVSFDESKLLVEADDKPEELKTRPPIVTIMGHVDHGKTSLLDAIRETNVAAGEAGGITQHIGAYTVEKGGKWITFIDTPGHEAFAVMRARGANVTDIVVLVVAADDGVMPQTREAISHAKAAKVPIIVAVNKIDKQGANPERIKQALSELELLAEDWGGDTMFVPVSAIKKTGLDKLLESILLQTEVLDLKSNPDARAEGSVLEARLDKGRGPVVSLLVNKGTLRVGDPVVSGPIVGRVKSMTDASGKQVAEVAPGWAAEVLGFESVPNAGEPFNAVADDSSAREIVANRRDAARAKAALSGQGKVSLEDLFAKIQAGDVKEMNVVLKTDVFGSAEAVRDSLLKLSTDKVKVKVIHSAPGGITESDVLLASASKAIIIGFNVRPETKARQEAEANHVEIRCYNIIYELVDDVKKAMAGLLEKTKVERFLGRAEVRQTFNVPKIGTIAGSAVIDGKILRGANVRLLRDSRVIYDGKMSSLKRFKDDAKEVVQGYECGIGIENYNDIKAGDVIEAYQIDLVAPELGAPVART